jgi:hypothetical protein
MYINHLPRIIFQRRVYHPQTISWLVDIDLERSAQCCFPIASDKLLLADALKNICILIQQLS